VLLLGVVVLVLVLLSVVELLGLVVLVMLRLLPRLVSY
jgi:hypothetical protein